MTTATHEPVLLTNGVPPMRQGLLPNVLNVIVMDPDQKFGSLEEQICVLARHFRAQGCLFVPLFVCPPGPHKTVQFEERDVTAVCLDLARFRWARLWELVRLIHRHRIRVIHWNFTDPLANGYVWALTLL